MMNNKVKDGIKLWKVAVRALGWESTRFFFCPSLEEAEEVKRCFKCSNKIYFAGTFTKQDADELMFDYLCWYNNI